MKICEMQLYAWMLRNLSDYQEVMLKLSRALLQPQRCTGKVLRFVTDARMSGDTCTSLGNGFTNLMIMKFLCHSKGWRKCTGVVEGDDGIFRVDGPVPTAQEFGQLGFDVKMEMSDHVGDAGFCHLFFDEVDVANLRDPRPLVAKSGWTMSSLMHGGRKVMESLSKSKALSILCETPCNPISSQLALWVLRATEGVVPASIYSDPNWWWKAQVLTNSERCIALALRGPTLRQREFVARMWGVSVESQLRIEHYFKTQRGLHPIVLPELERHLSAALPAYAESWHKYVDRAKKGMRW
jgi:hypothetical protein